MFKVKFIGDKRGTFSWVSMGKPKSYSVDPGKFLTVKKEELPYILSFGKFEIVREDIPSIEVPAKDIVEKEKVSPIIEQIVPIQVIEVKENPVVVPEPVVEVPVAAPVNEPVVQAPVVPEPEKMDYTSLRKKELVTLCKERGLETFGNRDDLIARLCADDKGIKGL